MKISRRDLFVKLGKGAAYVAVLASLPKIAWAKWNAKAFASTDLKAAIEAKYGSMSISDSDKVILDAPEIAENGSVVPITVSSSLPNVSSMSIFVEKNPTPLVTSFAMGKNSINEVSIRIRMGTTSNVILLVEADGKLHRAQQEVKVTIGGCGG